MKPVIEITERTTADGTIVVVKPHTFLRDGMFRTYVDAVKRGGGVFDRNLKANVAPSAFAWSLRHELEAAGFECADPAEIAVATEARQAAVANVKLPRLVAMLQRAASKKLKYPKIRFALDEGSLMLSVAGERARHPGSLNVTSMDRSFAARDWYGRVMVDGSFQPAPSCPSWVTDVLVRLETDPAGMAKSYGDKTGHCCFCTKHLSTPESVSAGYGPVCADKFGLPWGDVIEDVEEVAA